MYDMSNTICNIAVISFPRTASRSLAKHYSTLLNKPTAMGVLHTSEFLHGNEYNIREVVLNKKHILHGHWHTLNLLDAEILEFIKNNYKIVSSVREQKYVKSSLDKITGSTVDFNSLVQQTINEKQKWAVYKTHQMCGDIVKDIIDTPKDWI